MASSQAGFSVRAYARHRGCQHRNVQKAIAAGRLTAAVMMIDGHPRIVDFATADAEWDRTVQRVSARPEPIVHAATAAATADDLDMAECLATPTLDADRIHVHRDEVDRLVLSVQTDVHGDEWTSWAMDDDTVQQLITALEEAS